MDGSTMKTDIPEGTIVKMLWMGEWDYGKVVRFPRNPYGIAKGGIKGFIPPPGDDFGIQLGHFSDEEKSDAVYAVWKDYGTRLVIRD